MSKQQLLEKNISLFKIQDFNEKFSFDSNEGTQLSRYTQRFLEFIPSIESLSQEKIYILSQFAKGLKLIDTALAPFEKNGIGYSLAIGGGCIRDFITGKISEIKDMDIMVYFFDLNGSIPNMVLKDDTHIKSSCLRSMLTENIRKKLFMYEHKSPDELEKNTITEICGELISKEMKVEKLQYSKNGLVSTYMNSFIHGNIKISSLELQYPIDLIIAKAPFEEFIHTFDFGLCKIGASYKKVIHKQSAKTQCVFDDTKADWQNIYDNLYVPHTFLIDLQHKTFSLLDGQFEKAHVDYFMQNHYPKMKQKYPDFHLNVIRNPDNRRFFHHKILNEMIGEEKDVIKKMKI